jgi:hypothetical protein
MEAMAVGKQKEKENSVTHDPVQEKVKQFSDMGFILGMMAQCRTESREHGRFCYATTSALSRRVPIAFITNPVLCT